MYTELIDESVNQRTNFWYRDTSWYSQYRPALHFSR